MAQHRKSHERAARLLAENPSEQAEDSGNRPSPDGLSPNPSSRHPAWPLHHPRASRLRWHGRGLSRARPTAAARCRHQAAAGPRGLAPRSDRALQAGGEAARRAEPSQHCRHLRPARGGRRHRPDSRARRRPHAGEPAQGRAASVAGARSDRETDRGGARGRAREGDRSPRSQARQREGAARWRGQGARLRHCEGAQCAFGDRCRRRTLVVDGAGCGVRDACLHEPGAAARTARRPPRGHVGLWPAAVGNAHREAGVWWRHARGSDRRRPQCRTGVGHAAPQHTPVRPSPVGAHAAEGSQAAARLRVRCQARARRCVQHGAPAGGGCGTAAPAVGGGSSQCRGAGRSHGADAAASAARIGGHACQRRTRSRHRTAGGPRAGHGAVARWARRRLRVARHRRAVDALPPEARFAGGHASQLDRERHQPVLFA